MYFYKSTLVVIAILLALSVFAGFIVGLFGDETMVIIQQIRLLLEFYVQLN